jgi:hypothetical protein
MRTLSNLFESKLFGAVFIGLVALVAFEGGAHDGRLLAIPLVAVAGYYLFFDKA